jgi:hypothetical protein
MFISFAFRSEFIIMKKLLKHPGFEAIFYTGILLLLVLPAMVFAQQGNKLYAMPNGKPIILTDTVQTPVFKYKTPGGMMDNPAYKLGTGNLLNKYDSYKDGKNELRINMDDRITYATVDHMPILHPDMGQYRVQKISPQQSLRNDLDFNFYLINKPTAGTTDQAVFDRTSVPAFSTGNMLIILAPSLATPAGKDGKTILSEKSTGK